MVESIPARFVTTDDGVRIAYARQGDGPPVVFVRGWITHLELLWEDAAFRRFFEVLTRYVELIRFDARGNGLSDRRVDRLDLDGLTADLEAVMDAIGPGPVTMWGSSFGGPIAINYVARHPERVSRLVLDGTFASGRDVGSDEQRAAWIKGLEGLRLQPEAIYASLSFMTDPDPEASHSTRVDRLRRSINADTAIRLYELATQVDVTDLLPDVRVPALVLHRRGTRALPFWLGRRLAALLPDAQFVALEGTAHNLWEEAPYEALGALAGFLGLPASASPVGGPTSEVEPPVAILVTDIVGSTEFTGRMGDAPAQELVRLHNRVVREALEEHGGRHVKHTGDGIMAAFRSVTQAVACGLTIQRRLGEERAGGTTPDVRIGINAGEPLSEDDDLFGTVVQLAHRTCAEAGAAEVLVTNVVRELAAGKGFTFEDAGVRELKGFPDPVPLWRARITG